MLYQGIDLLDQQVMALAMAEAAPENKPLRKCLYFPTGKAKTLTSLIVQRARGNRQALVVAPPSTHSSWAKAAARLGMASHTVSHAKFRQKDFRISRSEPVIVDEFHMLGGQKAKGWRKMATLARHSTADVVICSATPNYNDYERVYCIKHILNPEQTKGGYLQFLYSECETEQNPFALTPNVVRFRHYRDPEHYLMEMENVLYLPDELQWSINDWSVRKQPDLLWDIYGLDLRRGRVLASQMEARHAEVKRDLLAGGELRVDVLLMLHEIIFVALPDRQDAFYNVKEGVLIFAVHKEVVAAATASLRKLSRAIGVDVRVEEITGDTPGWLKEARLTLFREGKIDILIGTATLGTGTDGLDKVCDTLIILDDTDDNAFRRQLVGRIMPRGLDTDASLKEIYRINRD